MINKVTITNYVGDSLVLELTNPWNSGFVVQSITGISPAKANVNITEIVTADGGLFNNSRLESRNIVFNLIFLEKPTIEDVRHLSYRYFPVKKPLTIKFETDSRVAEITGYVESNEINIFSQQEGCQISVLCPDPNFYSDVVEHKLFSSVKKLFHFPFANKGTDSKTLVFGKINKLTQEIIYYQGDEDIGLVFEINASGPAENITIYNSLTNKTFSIDTDKLSALTGDGIIAGDTILINTVKGKKSVQLIRNGVTTNILNIVNKNAEWFQLVSGDNIFVFDADFGLDKLRFTTRYQVVYEGV